jgi:hypothetical protein
VQKQKMSQCSETIGSKGKEHQSCHLHKLCDDVLLYAMEWLPLDDLLWFTKTNKRMHQQTKKLDMRKYFSTCMHTFLLSKLQSPEQVKIFNDILSTTGAIMSGYAVLTSVVPSLQHSNSIKLYMRSEGSSSGSQSRIEIWTKWFHEHSKHAKTFYIHDRIEYIHGSFCANLSTKIQQGVFQFIKVLECPVEYVTNTFDFDILQNRWNGERMCIKNAIGIAERTITVSNPVSCASIATYRVLKYEKKGFRFDIEQIQGYTERSIENEKRISRQTHPLMLDAVNKYFNRKVNVMIQFS